MPCPITEDTMIVREWLKKLMDTSERDVKRLMPIVQKINALEPDFQALSNEQLRAKTDEFRKRLQEGATLDDILLKRSQRVVKPRDAR
jgi:protein translocase subunit secA